MKNAVIDLRTEREKRWDADVQRTCERYKYIMETQEKATPRRAMLFIAKEEGLTLISVRSRLVKGGAYVINHRNGNGRTEGQQ